MWTFYKYFSTMHEPTIKKILSEYHALLYRVTNLKSLIKYSEN